VEAAVNTGCVLYKEGNYDGAAAKFKEAAGLDSSNPVRSYGIVARWMSPSPAAVVCCGGLSVHGCCAFWFGHLANI
jgi:hypothetical protein